MAKTAQKSIHEEKALVPQHGGGALELPDFLKGKTDVRGTETIGREDTLMPRFSLAQAMSPQLNKSEPQYIPDLSAGEVFNSVSNENYGEGPFEIVIVKRDMPRAIEFLPRSEGGGIKDPNVPLNDERLNFRVVNGERKKPQATLFHEFVVLLLPSMELVVLSFKSSGLKVAKRLNTLIKSRQQAIFAGRYTLSVVQAKSPKGTYYTFAVQNSEEQDEFCSRPGWCSQDLYAKAEKYFEILKDKEIVTDREPGADDADDEGFDPNKLS